MEMQFNYCVLMCLLWFNNSPGKFRGKRLETRASWGSGVQVFKCSGV
jgi:hypothetical protein